MIDRLRDNHLTIYHKICLTEEYKIPQKMLSAGIIYLFFHGVNFTEFDMK